MFGIILLLWYLLCMQKMKEKKNLLRKYIHTIVAEWRAVFCSGNSLRFIYVFKCSATACRMPKGSIYHSSGPKMFLLEQWSKRSQDEFIFEIPMGFEDKSFTLDYLIWQMPTFQHLFQVSFILHPSIAAQLLQIFVVKNDQSQRSFPERKKDKQTKSTLNQLCFFFSTLSYGMMSRL